jgi:hypothetical protein
MRLLTRRNCSAKGKRRRSMNRRLAESIYRAAVASGIMARVAYQDTIAEAG